MVLVLLSHHGQGEAQVQPHCAVLYQKEAMLSRKKETWATPYCWFQRHYISYFQCLELNLTRM